MTTRKSGKVEVDGRQYDAETVGEAMSYAIIGRAPVTVMSKAALLDGIRARIRWACGAVSLIAAHGDTPDDIKDTADLAGIQLEQAKEMFAALAEEIGYR